ncbi:MAG: hypothetical protein A3H25_18230 [Sphingomonadales bacterium RIFCSPLOWO2_12_FULL_63_15]|nr:MAG: hypothetical protein A3H25_18230 [Sphingomonadales bacterium RIFCSPLOWO2_12_FULL_63_15]
MEASVFTLHNETMMKPSTREKIANIVPFGLRMQPDLKQKVQSAADANGRSLNAEIVHRLETSLRDDAEDRSKLAKSRILAARLSGEPDPLQMQLDALDERVAALEANQE